jgi:hypothetical protein
MMTPPKLATAGWSLWAWWTVTYVIGYFGGRVVGTEVIAPVVDAVGAWRLAGALEVAIRGLSLGLLQWVILRRYIAQAHRWMWATTGVAVVASVGFPVIQLSVEAIFFTFAFEGIGRWIMTSVHVWVAMMLVLTGVMQWLVLRRQVRRAGWWIAATVAAHFFGVVAVYGIVAIYLRFPFVPYDTSHIFHLSELIRGSVIGALTGAVLVWLLGQPVGGERTAAP